MCQFTKQMKGRQFQTWLFVAAPTPTTSHHNLRPKRTLRHVQALKQQAKRRKRNASVAASVPENPGTSPSAAAASSPVIQKICKKPSVPHNGGELSQLHISAARWRRCRIVVFWHVFAPSCKCTANEGVTNSLCLQKTPFSTYLDDRLLRLCIWLRKMRHYSQVLF